jgi:hypothetical protein
MKNPPGVSRAGRIQLTREPRPKSQRAPKPQPRRFAERRGLGFDGAMPALTHRRYPERQDCWHVYYGDVHIGTIALRTGRGASSQPSKRLELT